MHATRRSPSRLPRVQRSVRDGRAMSEVPDQGPLAGRLPLRRLRSWSRLHAADPSRLRVRGLPQAALPARRHHLRADQDRPGALVPRHLPGDLEQGRDRRRRAAAAAGPGQLPDRLELAAQAPQGHGPPGSRALGRPGRGRRDLRRRPAARQARPRRRRQDAGRRCRRGRRDRGAPPRPAAARGGAPRLGREPRGLPRRGRRPPPPRGDRRPGSLEGSLGAAAATPTAVATDGWSGYAGLAAEGYAHEPVDPGAPDAALRLPGIHLVFGLVKRWLLGTHHGAVSKKPLPAYLDEYVFRFNRRTAKRISHGFARLVEQAVRTRPVTYRAIVAAAASA